MCNVVALIVIIHTFIAPRCDTQGLREKFFQGVRRSMPGPQTQVKQLQKNQKRSSFKFGPSFCPKLGEEQKKEKKKGLSSNLVPFFAKSQGLGQGRKKNWSKT